MQHIFEPSSFKRDLDGHMSHSKKWLGYEKGATFPEKRTIAKVENIAGVKLVHEFDLLLWIALDFANPLPDLAALFRARVPKKLHVPAIQLLKKIQVNHVPPGDLSIYELGDKICSEVGLTALAILILLHKEAQRANAGFAASMLGNLVFQMLIMLGAELHQRCIASELYAFMAKHYFPTDPHSSIDTTPSELSRMASVIGLLAYSNFGQTLETKVRFQQRAETMHSLKSSLHWIIPVQDIVFTPLHRESPNFSRDYANDLRVGRRGTWETLLSVLEDKSEHSDVHQSLEEHNIHLNLIRKYRFDEFLAIVRMQAQFSDSGHSSTM